MSVILDKGSDPCACAWWGKWHTRYSVMEIGHVDGESGLQKKLAYSAFDPLAPLFSNIAGALWTDALIPTNTQSGHGQDRSIPMALEV